MSIAHSHAACVSTGIFPHIFSCAGTKWLCAITSTSKWLTKPSDSAYSSSLCASSSSLRARCHWCVVENGSPQGVLAQQRQIGQTCTGQHQFGKGFDRAAIARIGQRNRPQQHLGKVDMGVKPPCIGIRTPQQQRNQPAPIFEQYLHAAQCRRGMRNFRDTIDDFIVTLPMPIPALP